MSIGGPQSRPHRASGAIAAVLAVAVMTAFGCQPPPPCTVEAPAMEMSQPPGVDVFFLPGSDIRLYDRDAESTRNGTFDEELPSAEEPDRLDHEAFDHLEFVRRRTSVSYQVTGFDWGTPTADDVLDKVRRQLWAQIPGEDGVDAVGISNLRLNRLYRDSPRNRQLPCAERDHAVIDVDLAYYRNTTGAGVPSSYEENARNAATWTVASYLARQEQRSGVASDDHREFYRLKRDAWANDFEPEEELDTTDDEDGDGGNDRDREELRPAELQWEHGDLDFGTHTYNARIASRGVTIRNVGEEPLRGSLRIRGEDPGVWTIEGIARDRQIEIPGQSERGFEVGVENPVDLELFSEQRPYEGLLVFEVAGDIEEIPKPLPLSLAIEKGAGDDEEPIDPAYQPPPVDQGWTEARDRGVDDGIGSLTWRWRREGTTVVLEFRNTGLVPFEMLAEIDVRSPKGRNATGGTVQEEREIRKLLPPEELVRVELVDPLDGHLATQVDIVWVETETR